MNFQSFGFLAFLIITLSLCLTISRRDRAIAVECLTLSCLAFYIIGGGWGSFLVLAAGLAVSTAAVHYMTAEAPLPAAAGNAPAIPRDSSRRRRRWLLAASAWHIGVLVAFKYAGFLTGGRFALNWTPLGLSFFTFQQLWLLKEAYDGGFHPGQGDNLPLYAFFFPSVVSGPILKPQAFFPQLHGEKFLRPDGQDFAAGFYAISVGMAKKVLLADNLGIIVSAGWDRLGYLSAPAAWVVILGYALQLYLDFSGYCDIASGTARLLGVQLPVNFSAPYRSLSIDEFWKRWHITLTSFLRECLYFPLGGSRKGTIQAYRNIMLVFLVSGIWHGAGWTFIAWGCLHGLGQVIERLWGPGRNKLPKLLRWALTFGFVNAAWVFFRAPNLPDALRLLRASVTNDLRLPYEWLVEGVFRNEAKALRLLFPAWARHISPMLAVLLFAVSLAVSLWPRREEHDLQPAPWLCVVMALLMGWSILSFTGVATFIYSNF